MKTEREKKSQSIIPIIYGIQKCDETLLNILITEIYDILRYPLVIVNMVVFVGVL